MSRAHPRTGSNISPRWRESRPKSRSPEHPKTMDFECSKSYPSPNSEDVWMKMLFPLESAEDRYEEMPVPISPSATLRYWPIESAYRAGPAARSGDLDRRYRPCHTRVERCQPGHLSSRRARIGSFRLGASLVPRLPKPGHHGRTRLSYGFYPQNDKFDNSFSQPESENGGTAAS